MRPALLALAAIVLLGSGACADAYPEGSPGNGRGGSGGSGGSGGPGGSGGTGGSGGSIVPDVATSCRTACEAIIECLGNEPYYEYDVEECIQSCSADFGGDDPCLKASLASCAACIAADETCGVQGCEAACDSSRCTGRCGGCESEHVCVCDGPDACWCEYDPCAFCGADEVCECDYDGHEEYCACVPDPCGGTCEPYEWCDCWSTGDCFCTSEDY